MTPDLAQLLYWAADNMRLWTAPVIVLLAYGIVGLMHLVAVLGGEG